MRLSSVALAASLAAAALAPATALAREPAAPVADDGAVRHMADKLNDPRTQMAVTAALVAMSEALLDIKVEPFAKAAEAAGARDAVRDLPPDATLRDLAGQEADQMQTQLARRTPEMMGRAAGMATALEALLPQLRAMAERMKDALPRSLPGG